VARTLDDVIEYMAANLITYRRLHAEEQSTKTMFPGFETHLNVGTSSPKALKSGEEHPGAAPALAGYANKAPIEAVAD
jgi:hypothetical protein